jgi:hypothetical protein
VAATSAVTATFSEAVQASSVRFTLKDGSNNPVAASVTYDPSSYTVTLMPSTALSASTTYTAAVTGAQDYSGNVMTSSTTWSFTTAAAPLITAMSPAPGATGVATSSPLVATFSQSMQPSSIDFTLTDPAGHAVPASLSYSDAMHTETLTPSSPLAASTTYTAALTAGTSAAGYPLSNPTTWTFTTAAAPQTTPAYIQTDYDKIPNFGANATIVSVASGPWSSPSTWSAGRVPTTGDVVSIAPNTTVTYDTASSAVLDTIAVQAGGTLQFRTDVNTQVIAANYLVMPGGTLTVGTPSSPVAPNVTATIMTANQPLNTSVDPEQYGDSLIGLGKVTISGAPKTTFVRLATEPRAGNATLTLSQPATGWQVGDELYIPDTRQLDWNEHGSNYVSQVETPTVAAISADGLTVTLASALKYNHLGARDGNSVLVDLPHVADETRNVVVRSQSGANRGQVMFLQRADVDVRYANFFSLGRTTISPVDNTTFNSSGQVTHIGTNEADRVPVQFRHLWGPTTAPADGYQFTFVGNMVDCRMMNQNHVWAIDIDDSHFGLVQDNVVDNWSGAGIVTETGSETHNRIDHNFVARINGTGERIDTPGTAGDGFWLRGPDNYVDNNVATDINPSVVYSYGFNVFSYYLGTVQVPAYQGADPALSGQSVSVNMNATPLRSFTGNEVYGATPNGLTLWWLGTFYRTPQGSAGTVQNFLGWSLFQWGYFAYETNNLTIDGFVIRDNPKILEGISKGIWFADYYQKNLVITNSDIQGAAIGIMMPILSDGASVVQNTYLRNATDVVVPTVGSANGADGLPAKSSVFQNDTFAATAGSPLDAIEMDWGTNGPGCYGPFNYIVPDQVFVYNYNNVSGDNFQVFYKEQSPSFVVPQTGGGNVGSPSSGLTNAQIWSTYGIAIAGAVLPSNATTRGGIIGYVLPIGSSANASGMTVLSSATAISISGNVTVTSPATAIWSVVTPSATPTAEILAAVSPAPQLPGAAPNKRARPRPVIRVG